MGPLVFMLARWYPCLAELWDEVLVALGAN